MAVFTGYETPPFYDSLVVKLTTHGADRDGTSSRACWALEEHRSLGIKILAPLHIRLMDDEALLLG